MSESVKARVLLVVLCVLWGTAWPMLKIALIEMPPLQMRTTTALLGLFVLLPYALVQRRSLRIPPGLPRLHVVIAGITNIASFAVFSAIAQLEATTSRVAILAYTMPIWAALLARPILGERFTRLRVAALALCAFGLVVLLAPLVDHGIPSGIGWALSAAVAWAIGTVYLKWARIQADVIALTFWQLAVSLAVIAGSMLVVDGPPQLHPISWLAIGAVAYSGLIGAGVCYLLWFIIATKLPAITVTLGVLGSPVVGVISSVILVGDRPTPPDIIGFALIFAASALVLAAPLFTPATRRQIEAT
jgi:drug/metabolite transporter (DMT)-like permease